MLKLAYVTQMYQGEKKSIIFEHYLTIIFKGLMQFFIDISLNII